MENQNKKLQSYKLLMVQHSTRVVPTIENRVILHLWCAFWAGEAWFEIYVEAQYIPLAAAHVAFGLLRKNNHIYNH